MKPVIFAAQKRLTESLNRFINDSLTAYPEVGRSRYAAGNSSVFSYQINLL